MFNFFAENVIEKCAKYKRFYFYLNRWNLHKIRERYFDSSLKIPISARCKFFVKIKRQFLWAFYSEKEKKKKDWFMPIQDTASPPSLPLQPKYKSLVNVASVVGNFLEKKNVLKKIER